MILNGKGSNRCGRHVYSLVSIHFKQVSAIQLFDFVLKVLLL